MTFVVDENISFGLVERLQSRGHDVLSVSEDPKRGLTDDTIFALVRQAKAILITRDYHFTNTIRFPAKHTEGIIYVRHGNLHSKEEINLILHFLLTHSPEWFRGKLVILSKERSSIR